MPSGNRGGSFPYPTRILATGIFATGILALTSVLVGTPAVQILYALGETPLSPACKEALATSESSLVTGALGVCHIVQAFRSTPQTALLLAGMILGAVTISAGFSSYRRMPSRRTREQCISGAVLGIQAVALAGFILWFRSGDLFRFARQFLNIEFLEGSLAGFISGAKNTLVLAFAGEIGGVIIGLLLSVLMLSSRRVVRAPARVYVNFFRGTPLLFQLSFFFFAIVLGLGIRLQAFEVAILVFCLNTGAYAAEVFRAGIQSIERGQMEAARSLGMTYSQAMRYSIIPQAVRRVIPPLMNEFVILIKDTSLITVLGLLATELDIYSFGRQGYASTGNATYFMAVAFAYLVVTLPLIGLVNIVEKRMRSGLTGIVGA